MPKLYTSQPNIRLINMQKIKCDVVIAASGKSERMDGKDKLFLPLAGDSVVSQTIQVFLTHPSINRVIVVCRADMIEELSRLFPQIIVCEGGTTRTQSVENGLQYCISQGVLIHDGARPFVSHSLISQVIQSVSEFGSGIPAMPITDSVRQARQGVITGTPLRNEFYTVQTPQGFNTNQIRIAYSQRNGKDYTDDAELYSLFIAPPKIIKGEERNIKLTTLGSYLGITAKIGIGYDLHTLATGRKLVLGGINIPSEKGALAHSDGDVIIHALIDALLSAIGERDIGSFFPDTDPKYKNIDSSILLSKVMQVYKIKNYRLLNASITVILDTPKLAGYIFQMRTKLGNLLGTDIANISIAAKTSEQTAPNTVAAYAAVSVN